jgi:hypothetical protein
MNGTQGGKLTLIDAPPASALCLSAFPLVSPRSTLLLFNIMQLSTNPNGFSSHEPITRALVIPDELLSNFSLKGQEAAKSFFTASPNMPDPTTETEWGLTFRKERMDPELVARWSDHSMGMTTDCSLSAEISGEKIRTVTRTIASESKSADASSSNGPPPWLSQVIQPSMNFAQVLADKSTFEIVPIDPEADVRWTYIAERNEQKDDQGTKQSVEVEWRDRGGGLKGIRVYPTESGYKSCEFVEAAPEKMSDKASRPPTTRRLSPRDILRGLSPKSK